MRGDMEYARWAVAVALAASAGAAQAAGAGLRIGTTGVGADFGWDIAPTLGGRLGVSAGSWSTDFDTSEVQYDAKLKLGNVNAFLDWSPLGPFRITAGVIANNNKVDLVGRRDGFDGTVTGTVKPGHGIAPYLGIGYGNVWTRGVNFYFDLGVMFQGSPKASLAVNCGPTTPAQCAAAQAQVAAEQQRVQDELKNFKYYPVANIGITIGF
jgi:hypothetical protein